MKLLQFFLHSRRLALLLFLVDISVANSILQKARPSNINGRSSVIPSQVHPLKDRGLNSLEDQYIPQSGGYHAYDLGVFRMFDLT